MKSSEIRRLVVVEGGKIVGVLSERRVLEKSEVGLIQEISKRKKISVKRAY
jgi:signal-transduction protein with cAMP-binding, CBS, and nucleotidyltransferase domain